MGIAIRVLLIDDEPVVLRSLEAFLRREGHVVATATTGETALARLEAGEAFDVLVVDKNLPGMNGLELIRRAREMRPELGAIVITGYPSVASSRESDQVGAGAYLIKPFRSLDEVRDAVARVTPTRASDPRHAEVTASLQALTARLRQMNARLAHAGEVPPGPGTREGEGD